MHRCKFSIGIIVAVLLITATTLISAQTSPGSNRAKLRAEVIRLQTEVEMLRFDYELAREKVLEELKIIRGFRMAGGMFQLAGGIQTAINDSAKPEAEKAPKPDIEQDRKKAAAQAKVEAEEEKKYNSQVTEIIAERKKELARLFNLLAEKRLDLEDAERAYREMPR